jgi:hypothetical protein
LIAHLKGGQLPWEIAKEKHYTSERGGDNGEPGTGWIQGCSVKVAHRKERRSRRKVKGGAYQMNRERNGMKVQP